MSILLTFCRSICFSTKTEAHSQIETISASIIHYNDHNMTSYNYVISLDESCTVLYIVLIGLGYTHAVCSIRQITAP